MGGSYVIDAGTVEQEVRSRRPVVLIDARPAAAYRAGHIPGAVNLDLFDYFVDTSDEGIDRLNRDLGDLLGGVGIDGRERVVCYEDELGMRAARILWLVEYAGHPDVRVLRGGFPAWLAAGGSRCVDPCVRPRREFLVHSRPEVLATADYLSELASGRRGIALDVRSLAEHRGETTSSHGPCCARAGRVPGSIWLEWTALLTADHQEVRPAADIRRALGERGVTPEHEIVTYCHRGARAAAAYVALKEAGFPRVRNYIGSWHEWAGIPRLPVETAI